MTCQLQLIAILLSSVVLSATSKAQSHPKNEIYVAASAEEICPLKVGTRIPSVQLRTLEGDTVELTLETAKKPTLLIFYRGGWCVYCNRQMSTLKQIEQKILELGYQLIAISPDRPEKLRESVEKHHLSYTLLSDSKMIAARAFGLAFQVSKETLERYKTINIDLEGASGESHHLLPVPAVFVLGADGIIKFGYVNPNYKARIDLEVLLSAAKAALK